MTHSQELSFGAVYSVSVDETNFRIFQRNYKDDPNEPPHDKTNKMTCAHSEDSDQPGHQPSLM